MSETLRDTRKEFQLERMILFSDAVFAIAITLLAIELKLPDRHAAEPSEGAILHAVFLLVPSQFGSAADGNGEGKEGPKGIRLRCNREPSTRAQGRTLGPVGSVRVPHMKRWLAEGPERVEGLRVEPLDKLGAEP